MSITVHRADGGVIDMEMIRPTEWIEANGVRAGRTLPMHIDELQVNGIATVTAVAPCPPIVSGEGSVVTAQFITRQVDEIAVVRVLGADGQIKTIEGTTVHPVWSVDRHNWVPLGDLENGENLLGESGVATIFDAEVIRRAATVYNIEVHGEHVYEISELALMVHNAYSEDVLKSLKNLAAKRKELQTTINKAQERLDDLQGSMPGPLGGPITQGNDAIKQMRIEALTDILSNLKNELIENMNEIDRLI